MCYLLFPVFISYVFHIIRSFLFRLYGITHLYYNISLLKLSTRTSTTASKYVFPTWLKSCISKFSLELDKKSGKQLLRGLRNEVAPWSRKCPIDKIFHYSWLVRRQLFLQSHHASKSMNSRLMEIFAVKLFISDLEGINCSPYRSIFAGFWDVYGVLVMFETSWSFLIRSELCRFSCFINSFQGAQPHWWSSVYSKILIFEWA